MRLGPKTAVCVVSVAILCLAVAGSFGEEIHDLFKPPMLDPLLERTSPAGQLAVEAPELPSQETLVIPSAPALPQDGDAKSFRKAAATLDDGNYAEAVKALEAFLHLYPQGKFAPEARYRLAAAYLLLGDAGASKKTLDVLVKNHFSSPWARLTLLTQFDETTFFDMAKERQKQARRSREAAEVQTAIDAFQLFRKRFPQSERKKEVCFRIGHIALTAGDAATGKQLMTTLVQGDADGTWGKLAAFQLGDSKHFRDGMDDLIKLTDGRDMRARTFLDLALRFQDSLEKPDRAKCVYYRGQFLREQEEELEGLAVLHQVVENFPESPWAADAAFWLAEHDFTQGRLERARERYQAFLQRYPETPWAGPVRRWLRALDELPQATAAAEKAVASLLVRLLQARTGLSLAVLSGDALPDKALEVRFACRGSVFFFRSRFGTIDFQAGSSPHGSWYYSTEMKQAVRAASAMDLPTPQVFANIDPATQNLNFGATVNAGQEMKIDLPPELAGYVVGKIAKSTHLSRTEVRTANGKPGQVLCVEYPDWEGKKVTAIEIELDAAGQPAEVRLVAEAPLGQRKVSLRVTDLVFGNIPESALPTGPPPGVEVRDVPTINPLDAGMQIVRIGLRWMELYKDDFAGLGTLPRGN